MRYRKAVKMSMQGVGARLQGSQHVRLRTGREELQPWEASMAGTRRLGRSIAYVDYCSTTASREVLMKCYGIQCGNLQLRLVCRRFLVAMAKATAG